MCSSGNGTGGHRRRLHLRQGIHLGIPAGKSTVSPGMGAHRQGHTAKLDRLDRRHYRIAVVALQRMLG
jgi:hypothetical protein